MSADLSGTVCIDVECGHVARGGSAIERCAVCGGETLPVDDVVTPPDCPTWCQHPQGWERTSHVRAIAADLVLDHTRRTPVEDFVELELTQDGDAHGELRPPMLEFASEPPEALSLDDAEKLGRMLLTAVQRARDLTS